MLGLVDVLKRLLMNEKINEKKINKKVKEYLNYLSEKYEWFYHNKENKFYCPNYYYKKKHNILRNEDVRIKYFWHQLFPPKHKKVPNIPLNEITRKLIKGTRINKKVFDEKTIKDLLKKGFIQEISENEYESTGVSLKYYHDSEDSFGLIYDSFDVYNFNNKEIIVEVKPLKKDKKAIITTKSKIYELSRELSERWDKIKDFDFNKELEKILKNHFLTNPVIIKPYSYTKLEVIVLPYDPKNIECYQLVFKARFTERSIRLPYWH